MEELIKYYLDLLENIYKNHKHQIYLESGDPKYALISILLPQNITLKIIIINLECFHIITINECTTKDNITVNKKIFRGKSYIKNFDLLIKLVLVNWECFID